MENDTEVIRQQMEGTRQALSEKVEAVEELVASAVKETTQAVTKTVETVSNTVENTVNTVSDSVESVKEAFNVSACVDKYPWSAMAGSAALGYLIGSMLPPSNGHQTTSGWGVASATPTVGATGTTHNVEALSSSGGTTSTSSGSFLPQSWLSLIDKVKGLALGATAGMVGEMVMNMVPDNLKSEVSKLIDEATQTLGGTVVRRNS